MKRGRLVSGALVALAVMVAVIIVEVGPSTQHPSAGQAIATGPIVLVPSASAPSVSQAGGSLAAEATPPPSVAANMKLSFNATFSGSRLNTSQWSTCYPWTTGDGCTNFGNSNSEFEWYLPSQVRVYNNALHLVAQREPTAGTTQSGAPKEYPCRSGMVTTYKSFQFEYGYVQLVARIPYSKGLWSALWLAAANFQWPPEIDIMEHWSSSLVYHVYLHTPGGSILRVARDTPNLSNGWHVLSVSWTPTKLTWYVDGAIIQSTTSGIPRQPMYLITDLADNLQGAGSCSGALLVKSVRIWTLKS